MCQRGKSRRLAASPKLWMTRSGRGGSRLGLTDWSANTSSSTEVVLTDPAALHSLLDNPDNQKLRQELNAQIDATKAASKKLATDMQPNEEDVNPLLTTQILRERQRQMDEENSRFEAERRKRLADEEAERARLLAEAEARAKSDQVQET